jgi:succinoglycan biosynthesis protein ExoA
VSRYARHGAEYPFVSVLMPVRNEAGFIGRVIEGVLAQDYPPDRLELIVADGMSTDGTRHILKRLQVEHPRVIVIDNPDRIVSTGLNAALAFARGDVIVRLDGRSLVAPDFVRQEVKLLAEHPEAWSVAGPIRHTATTPFGKAVALAMSHPIGVGSAFHRGLNYEGYTEGAELPAVRRWVFDEIGAFDVRLERNQDDEFSYRIAHAGGKTYVSPHVSYTHVVREHIGQLYKQYYRCGFWCIPVIQKHGRPTTLRQVVPTLFYASCLAWLAAGLILNKPLVALGLPAFYAATLLGAGLAALPRHGVKAAALLPVAIAVMQAGYGLGFGYGLWARLFRPGAWNTNRHMAAISR